MRRTALIVTSALAAAVVSSVPAQAASAPRHLAGQVRGNVVVLTRVGTARVFQNGAHDRAPRSGRCCRSARCGCCGCST